jgi:hypothetical protein
MVKSLVLAFATVVCMAMSATAGNTTILCGGDPVSGASTTSTDRADLSTA